MLMSPANRIRTNHRTNQTAVNQTAINQTTINQTTVNQTAINQTATIQTATDRTFLRDPLSRVGAKSIFRRESTGVEKLYEGLFLLDANEAARSWSDMESHIGSLLTKNEAKLEYSERWSDRKLAYPVDGVTKGTYYLSRRYHLCLLAFFLAPAPVMLIPGCYKP